MRNKPFTPNPALVSFLGLAPLIGASADFASGALLGLVMSLGVVSTAGIASLARAKLDIQLAVAAQLAFAAVFATASWLLVEAFSPLIAESLGLYLPLVAVSSLLVHELRRAGGRDGEGARPIFATAGWYLLVSLLSSTVRELAGGGSITFPSAGISQMRLTVFPFAPFPIFASPAGGFLVLAFFAIADRVAFPRQGVKEGAR